MKSKNRMYMDTIIGENQHLAYAKTMVQISTYVFASLTVQCLYFLNPKFPASSHLLWLLRLVCVILVQKLNCWFSHKAAHILTPNQDTRQKRKYSTKNNKNATSSMESTKKSQKCYIKHGEHKKITKMLHQAWRAQKNHKNATSSMESTKKSQKCYIKHGEHKKITKMLH